MPDDAFTPDRWDDRYVPLREHMEALREAEVRFQAERDRRYNEVATEREKALALLRDFQRERDTRSDEQRDLVASERGNYATKGDLSQLGDKFIAAIEPIRSFQNKLLGLALASPIVTGLIFYLIANQ